MSLKTLRARTTQLTDEQRVKADELLRDYLARPQHRDRMNAPLRAALTAAAHRVAIYGNPPGYNARAAYRMHKKRRAKLEAARLYGDPCRPESE